VSFLITGAAVVSADGTPATRWRSTARALMVWMPVALLLAASVWVQAHAPGLIGLYSLLWWLAVGVLLAYVFVAVSFPERPPQDRWLGTRIVPR
jgi:hypothetical protein